MTLSHLRPGESGKITKVNGHGALRRRLLDMGLTPGTLIKVRKIAPFGDPMEISLRGYELTLRKDDAHIIQIQLEERVSFTPNCCEYCNKGKCRRRGSC